MTPERLRRIRAAYEAALEVDPGAREAFLERECQADEDLRKGKCCKRANTRTVARRSD